MSPSPWATSKGSAWSSTWKPDDDADTVVGDRKVLNLTEECKKAALDGKPPSITTEEYWDYHRNLSTRELDIVTAHTIDPVSSEYLSVDHISTIASPSD